MSNDTIYKPANTNGKGIIIALIALIAVIILTVTVVVIVLLKKDSSSTKAEIKEENVIEFSADWSSYSVNGTDVDSSDYKLPLTGDTGNTKTESFPETLPEVK